MKDTQTLLQEQMKEFDENLSEYIKPISIGQYNDNGVNIGFISSKEKIKHWHTQSIKEILQAEVEYLKQYKKEKQGLNPFPTEGGEAITDQINRLTHIIEAL